VVAYSYNTAARTRTITYPSGRQVTETKDWRDRLWDVSDTGGMIAQYSYDNGNRVGTRTYANGVVATYGYNANNWITDLSHAVGSASPLAAFHYAFDKEGNKLYEQKLHSLTNSEAYAYDNIYRLVDYKVGTLSGTNVPSPTTQTAWNLDPVGNWNTKTTDSTTETRSHSEANEITGIVISNQSSVISHDANGNLTNDVTQSYAYDENNRLVSVSSASSVVGEYSYDALGRRISKTITNGATCFYYDGARIIEEHDCGITVQVVLSTYTYGNYIDEVLTKTTPSGTLYHHQNTLWSVHALTDASGNVVERYNYDAYGKLTVLDPAGSPIMSPPLTAFTFTGREFDSESGLYHYRARTYSPVLGRFLSRDPLEYVNGMNLYEYCCSNTPQGLDPWGLCLVFTTTTAPTPITIPWGSFARPWVPPANLFPRPTTMPPLYPPIPVAPRDSSSCPSKSPQPAPWPDPETWPPKPGPVPPGFPDLDPPGDCTTARHRELQDLVDAACHNGLKTKCYWWTKDCDTLRERYYRNLQCARARDLINRECFRGGNPGHRQQVEAAITKGKKCWERYWRDCLSRQA
jgi:RHS repeat-associated protein